MQKRLTLLFFILFINALCKKNLSTSCLQTKWSVPLRITLMKINYLNIEPASHFKN